MGKRQSDIANNAIRLACFVRSRGQVTGFTYASGRGRRVRTSFAGRSSEVVAAARPLTLSPRPACPPRLASRRHARPVPPAPEQDTSSRPSLLTTDCKCGSVTHQSKSWLVSRYNSIASAAPESCVDLIHRCDCETALALAVGLVYVPESVVCGPQLRSIGRIRVKADAQ
jgi:hypothetical protein